jgi:hypothetical protein
MTPEQIARVCHEVNRAYCQSLGDDSQPEWADAPPEIRASAIAGVEAHVANPGLTPAESHEVWVDYKLAEGWVYDPVKSIADKTHPNLVPFENLPPEQQAKDLIFKACVAACLAVPPDSSAFEKESKGGTEIKEINA